MAAVIAFLIWFGIVALLLAYIRQWSWKDIWWDVAMAVILLAASAIFGWMLAEGILTWTP